MPARVTHRSHPCSPTSWLCSAGVPWVHTLGSPRPIAGDPALSVVDTERYHAEAVVEPRIPTSSLSHSYSLPFYSVLADCRCAIVGRTTDSPVLTSLPLSAVRWLCNIVRAHHDAEFSVSSPPRVLLAVIVLRFAEHARACQRRARAPSEPRRAYLRPRSAPAAPEPSQSAVDRVVPRTMPPCLATVCSSKVEDNPKFWFIFQSVFWISLWIL
jgi:hypothetical protein